MRYLHDRRARGFTLLEALLSSIVLAVCVAAITAPFAAAARNEQVEARRTLAVNLAQEIMEEILALPFDDDLTDYVHHPGPEADESYRMLFDNVDDYDEYAESPGTLTDVMGYVLDCPATADLSRHVTASYVYVSGQDTANLPNFVRIVVEIRYRGQPIVTLTRLIYDMPEP